VRRTTTIPCRGRRSLDRQSKLEQPRRNQQFTNGVPAGSGFLHTTNDYPHRYQGIRKLKFYEQFLKDAIKYKTKNRTRHCNFCARSHNALEILRKLMLFRDKDHCPRVYFRFISAKLRLFFFIPTLYPLRIGTSSIDVHTHKHTHCVFKSNGPVSAPFVLFTGS